jgi:hypothetical protein
MMNTLDLDPEWGAIDLIEEVEEAFGIKIADKEAEQCETVGDLYIAVCAHVPEWDTQSGKCSSSMTFYKIRRALDPDRTTGLTPRTVLTGSDRPAKLFGMLASKTGLRLPEADQTWLGKAGGLVFTFGLIAVIATLLMGHWAVSGLMLVIGALGGVVGWMDRGKLPPGISTVADLVRRTAPLNTPGLRTEGGRPSDRWSILVALAAEHSSLTPDEISPETYLHLSSLKMATAA